MSDKLELKEKIQAVDQNVRELWDALDETNQKSLKNDFFILNRYISNVKGQSREVQEHFVLTVNEYFNKYWFDIQKHPKLVWLLLCMCSYDGQRSFFHEWIGNKKRKTDNKKIKFIEELYPDKNETELQLLCRKYSSKDLIELAREQGLDDSTINKKLK